MAGPDPALAVVRRAVAADLADLADGELVLVACSGGADSLALAAATAFCVDARRPVGAGRRGRPRLRAGAVVVDHRWHPDSAAVAERAGQTCRELGLDPVVALAVEPDALDGWASAGPEGAARLARYALLDAAADRFGAAAVLLGHTRDDQAETVLLGLARGSGARSLAGMRARRGVYRRPLLGVSREQTRRAAQALDLPVWDDPANDDPAYSRARLRAAMQTLDAALGPGLPAALARTAEQLAEDAECLEAQAEELLSAALRPGTGSQDTVRLDVVRLDVVRLAAAPAAVRRRALLRAVRDAGAPAASVARTHVLAVDALVTDWHGQGPVHLPGRVVVIRSCGTLAVDRAPGSAATGTGGDDEVEEPRGRS